MDPTTDPMQAAVDAVLASEDPIEPETEDDAQASEPAPDEDEPDPVDDADTDDDPASDPDQDEPASSDEEPADLHDITVDGQVRKMTLEELKQKAALADGAHVRLHKAHELSKAAQQEVALAAQAAQHAVALAQELQAQGLVPRPVEPDPRLGQTNPAAFFEQLARYQAQAKTYEAQQAKIAQQREYAAHAQQIQLAATIEQGLATLVEKRPELKDPAKFKEFSDWARRGAQEHYGFNEQELAGITDPRTVQVLADALELRERKAKLQTAKTSPNPKPARHVPPAVKRAPDPMPEERKALLSLRKTRSASDAVRVLLARENS